MGHRREADEALALRRHQAAPVGRRRQRHGALRKRSEDVFAKADRDGSGALDLGEVRKMDLPGAEAFFSAHDGNSDGKVSLAEWLIYMKGCSATSEEAATAMLDRFDA